MPANEVVYQETICPVTGFQESSVFVPVAVEPFAQVGPITTKCLGEPVLTIGETVASCDPFRICKFVIGQRIGVEIPVVCGARTEVGQPIMQCDCVQVGN